MNRQFNNTNSSTKLRSLTTKKHPIPLGLLRQHSFFAILKQETPTLFLYLTKSETETKKMERKRGTE